ncbi:hypothetical protein D3C75_909660 [compost metagenome]
MRVGINASRKYITAGSVDDLRTRRFQIQADSGNDPVLDQNISCIRIRCGNDNAILDNLLHPYITSASEYKLFRLLMTFCR